MFRLSLTTRVFLSSAGIVVLVLAGTLVLTVDGKESKLPAGSYFAFTGKKPHATSCDAAADCILQIDARGKWDVKPAKTADPKKATK